MAMNSSKYFHLRFGSLLKTGFAIWLMALGSGDAAAAEPAFKSPILQRGSVPIDLDISGAKELWLVVSATENGMSFDWADWAEPRLIAEDGSVTPLTELNWKSAFAGWGTVKKNKNANGGPLKINRQPVSFGIGTHAPSLIHFELPRAFSRFTAIAGLDDGGVFQGGTPDVQFMVYTEQPPKSVTMIPKTSGGPMEAEESLETFELAEGLEATLFATEPWVKNPTNMDIDAKGRVWVTEGVNYRRWNGIEPKGDRIVILEDSDQDGKADQHKVYYQDPSINAALGIAVLGNKVIVSCSPNIFIFTDEDGDDVPDKKEVLFTGIRGEQHDHGAHAFTFGPDGKLYFNVGNNGYQVKSADGSPIVDRAGNVVAGNREPYQQGMVFRCAIDGSDFETLGHNFRNNYEVAVDSFGGLWQSDNDDDGNRGVRINYVMEFGNYGYRDEMTGAGWRSDRTNIEKEIPRRHWHLNDPGVVPTLLLTGSGSPTGILVYEGDLLPEVFHGQMIHCEAGHNVVRAYPVRADGAGYSAETVNILKSSEKWVRPADVCVAPDGSLMVADWYDAGVGGHAMADQDPEQVRGRIYRVAPEGVDYKVTEPCIVSLEDAIQALSSPNLATRYLGWTKLHDAGANAEESLSSFYKNSENPRMRARALHLLTRLEGVEARPYLMAALGEKNPDLRVTALRIVQEKDLDPIPYVREIVEDPSAAVRRQAAIVMRGIKGDSADLLWAELAAQHDGADRWYLEALGIGAAGLENDRLDCWLEKVGDGWNTAAGRDIVWRIRGTHALPYLVKLITSEETSETESQRYYRSLDFIPGPEKEAALLEILTGSL